ncbi:hypothetical protein VIGAN_03173000 [Vigna angularis var. angularis]|uniref:Uncharacterized protein n=1 Tax=Vigna angularis var. angularis TaxID=157739 RepID=A0A0S3RN44_PHAAN|nr:hypothetical protein VIGAN_03173000 [Vigna angularis var. angularis]
MLIKLFKVREVSLELCRSPQISFANPRITDESTFGCFNTLLAVFVGSVIRFFVDLIFIQNRILYFFISGTISFVCNSFMILEIKIRDFPLDLQ